MLPALFCVVLYFCASLLGAFNPKVRQPLSRLLVSPPAKLTHTFLHGPQEFVECLRCVDGVELDFAIRDVIYLFHKQSQH